MASRVNSEMLVCRSLFTCCCSICFMVIGTLTFRFVSSPFAIVSPW